MEEPIFKTELNSKEIIINCSIFLFVGVAVFFRSENDNFELKCLTGLFMFVFLLWILTRFKTYILYQNKLIVKLTFLPSLFNKIYKKNQISFVKFYFQGGRFGGNSILIYFIFIGDFDSFKINIKPDDRKLFIKCLNETGIKVVNDMPQNI
jgi:hypothetical protein